MIRKQHNTIQLRLLRALVFIALSCKLPVITAPTSCASCCFTQPIHPPTRTRAFPHRTCLACFAMPLGYMAFVPLARHKSRQHSQHASQVAHPCGALSRVVMPCALRCAALTQALMSGGTVFRCLAHYTTLPALSRWLVSFRSPAHAHTVPPAIRLSEFYAALLPPSVHSVTVGRAIALLPAGLGWCRIAPMCLLTHITTLTAHSYHPRQAA